MSKDLLLKVASVLEEAADVIDAQAVEKTAAVNKAREDVVKDVAAKYAALTGEELPSEELSKLASGEGLETFRKLLEKTASGAVESMGGSSEIPSGRVQPSNKKEAAQAAWDAFGSYINS